MRALLRLYFQTRQKHTCYCVLGLIFNSMPAIYASSKFSQSHLPGLWRFARISARQFCVDDRHAKNGKLCKSAAKAPFKCVCAKISHKNGPAVRNRSICKAPGFPGYMVSVVRLALWLIGDCLRVLRMLWALVSLLALRKSMCCDFAAGCFIVGVAVVHL